jgi:hypothetical protein
MSKGDDDKGELILYRADDGATEIQLRAIGGRVWLSLNQMADLFERDKSVISRHIKAVFDEAELTDSVVARYATTAADGKTYQVDYYALEMILAVGYRVRSQRGTQFRQWATARLKDYLVKGFVLDEKRLRDPGPFDYFDELLAKIRDIRASEKRFYQKARDLYTTASDYDPASDRAKTFFATVQNKLLYAVTQHTAAELIVARAKESLPNMGLTSFKGSKVRKGDVTIAKNYLGQLELDELNRLVSLFLDTAELRAKNRTSMTMAEWEGEIDRLLTFTEKPVLRTLGSMSHASMETIAHQRFETFDVARRAAELEKAEAEHEAELARIVDAAAKAKGKKP